VHERRDRVLFLDALRGLAVLLMMEQHLGVWLWRGPSPGERTPALLLGFNALGGMAAPLFVTLAGCGAALAVSRAKESAGAMDLRSVRRGLVLMGFGYLLSVMTPSWFTTRSWFVLHMMGFAFTLTPLWRRLPTGGLLGLAAAVIGATPIVQQWMGTPRMLTNDRMALKPPFEALAGGHLRVALLEGQFPILPWLALFLVGMVVGRRVAAGDFVGIRRLAKQVLAIGVGLAMIGYAGRYAPGLGFLAEGGWRRLVGLPLGFFPATSAVITLLMGGVLWLIVFAAAISERAPIGERSWWVCLGRASLTLLLVHVVLFRELTRPIGLWQAMSAEAALAIIGAWLVACVLLARVWARVGFRFGAEWLLRRVAG
jgi:uncharacterized membrane protein